MRLNLTPIRIVEPFEIKGWDDERLGLEIQEVGRLGRFWRRVRPSCFVDWEFESRLLGSAHVLRSMSQAIAFSVASMIEDELGGGGS